MKKTTFTLEIMRLTDKELHETLAFDTLEEAQEEASKLVQQNGVHQINIHQSIVESKIIREIQITNRK